MQRYDGNRDQAHADHNQSWFTFPPSWNTLADKCIFLWGARPWQGGAGGCWWATAPQGACMPPPPAYNGADSTVPGAFGDTLNKPVFITDFTRWLRWHIRSRTQTAFCLCWSTHCSGSPKRQRCTSPSWDKHLTESWHKAYQKFFLDRVLARPLVIRRTKAGIFVWKHSFLSLLQVLKSRTHLVIPCKRVTLCTWVLKERFILDVKSITLTGWLSKLLQVHSRDSTNSFCNFERVGQSICVGLCLKALIVCEIPIWEFYVATLKRRTMLPTIFSWNYCSKPQLFLQIGVLATDSELLNFSSSKLRQLQANQNLPDT